MATKRNILDATLDATLILKDAGAVTSSAAAQVGGAARVVNVGTGFMQGVVVVDFDVLDTTSGDEGYEVRLQGSSDPTFATDVSILGSVKAGVTAATGESGTIGIGRRSFPFINQSENGLALPYLRAYHVLAGTTPSVNYRAFISQNPLNG